MNVIKTPTSLPPSSRSCSRPGAVRHLPRTSNGSRIRQLALSCLLVSALGSELLAASGNSGTLTGRVQNAAGGKYLNNARVRVIGTDIETFTDASGEYRLTQLPEGPIRLEVYYSGMLRQEKAATIHASEPASQDFLLSAYSPQLDTERADVVQLTAFEIKVDKEYNAAAIANNEQRVSANLKNVVSTDAYGEINQGNVGEFVKHMPGVTIEFKDGNNASGINIRGFGTNYTRVTMDGNSAASTAIANTQTPNRQFVLEGASINSIARIEVTKEPLPDMPANAMGGSVNLISKSAFEYPKKELSFSTYLSANSYSTELSRQPGPGRHRQYHVLPSFSGSLVLPLSKTLGLVVSASSYDQYYNTVKISPARVFSGAGATLETPYTRSVAVSMAPNEVTSSSASIKLDWKPAEGSVLSFSASLTGYEQDTAGRTLSHGVGSGTPVSWTDTQTMGAVGSASGNSMGGGWQHRNALTRFIGANYRFNRAGWSVELAATYSDSTNRVRDIEAGFFTYMGTSLRGVKTVNLSGINNDDFSTLSVITKDAAGNAIDPTRLASYDMSTVGSQPFKAKDDVTEFRADITRELGLPWFPAHLKIGGATNDLTRDLQYSASEWTYVGPDGIAASGDESMARFLDPNADGLSPGFGLPAYQWASPWVAYDTFKSTPAYFTQTAAQLGNIGRQEAIRSPLLMERVSAGYAMLSAKLLRNRLRVVGGVRYEHTSDRGYGMKQDNNAVFQRDSAGKLIVSNGAYVLLPQLVGTASNGPERYSLIYTKRGTYNSRNYDGFFPSAATTFNITDNLLLRAAFAKTTGRPSPSDIVSTVSVSGNPTYDPSASGQYPGFITSSNTSLVPWSGKNYDLSLEYYLPHNGLVSVGVFRKDIRNFFLTVNQTADAALLESIGLGTEYLGYRWSTRVNGGDARIDGLELSYSQNLDFIPYGGRHFSLLANYTRLNVQGTNASNFNLKSGGGNIPTTGNAGLRFSRNRLTAGIYWNYRGRQFRDTSSAFTDARETVLSVGTWDANVEFQLTGHFALFAAGRNITNAATRWSLTGPAAAEWARVANYYQNGAQYSFGVKGKF